MIKDYILVALGGAIGSLGRFGISQFFSQRTDNNFPWATLIINLLGCFIIGIIIGIGERYQFVSNSSMRIFFAIGLCGGFTTFSTFSLETIRLFQNSQPIQALIYIFASLILGLILTLLGLVVVK